MGNIELKDEEIAHKVQQGSKDLFGLLVERYEAKMLRYARKFLFGYQDAEDVVQEVFLKVYSNIQRFDSTRGFSAWIYRVAHNEFINTIRKKGREPLSFFDPDAIFPHPIAKENVEKDLDAEQIRESLNKSLGKIDPKYREPLVLYYFEDLDYNTISEILHLPVSTVGVRLNRGKELLKKVIQSIN